MYNIQSVERQAGNWARILASVRFIICCYNLLSVRRSNFDRVLHSLIMVIKKDTKIKMKLPYEKWS